MTEQEVKQEKLKLLNEVERRLPNAGGRLGDEAGGYNDAIDDVTETLEAIKKEIV